MVSPFMSFATGALGAVNNQINKYQQTQAAEKLAEQEEQRELNKLEFDRATKELILKRRLEKEEKTAKTGAEARLEAARINAKSRRYAAALGATSAEEAAKTRAKSAAEVAGINKEARIEAEKLKQKANRAKLYFNIGGFEISKGATQAERVENLMSTFASNPEEFKAAYQDATKRKEIEREIWKAMSLTRNAQISNALPNPNTKAFFSQYRTNPLLASIIDSFGNNNAYGNPKGSSQVEIQGKVVTQPDDDIVVNAAKIYAKNRFSTEKVSPQQAGADLTKLIGTAYNPEVGPFEGANKYYTAATSDFVKFISDPRISSEEDKEKARAYIYNPDNGFLNEDGDLSQNAYKLINIYAIQDAQEDASSPYSMPKARTFGNLKTKDSNVRKEVEDITKVLPLATAALTTTDKLIEQVGIADTGSGLLLNVKSFLNAAPELMNESVSVIKSALTDPNLQGENFAKTRAMFTKDINNLSKAKQANNREGIAAAQVKMLQNMLAYQLTSILQGGTGGRTISDTDVTRALTMMGGNYDSKAQKLEKLGYIREMVTRSISRGKLFGTLDNTDNARKYNAIKKVDSLVATATRDNFDKIIEDKMKKNNPDYVPPGSSIEGAGVVTNLLNETSQLAGNNFNPEVWREGIETVTKGSSGKIQELGGKPFVVNPEARQMLKRLEPLRQQQGISSDAFIEGLKRVQDMHGQIFDVTSGKLVNIKYDADGSFNIVPEKPEQVEDPASRGGFGLGERLNKLFGGGD